MKMDDDIVRQAALRRQRRQHGGRDLEAGGFHESISGASSPMSISRNEDFLQEHENSLEPVGGTASFNRDLLIPPQVSRRRVFADRPSNIVQQREVPMFGSLGLPFISCMLKNREVKALINTCVMSSIINRHLFQNVFSGDQGSPLQFPEIARGVPIIIASRHIMFDFHIRGDIPDIVIGLDFLTRNKCIVDLGNRTFTVGGYDGGTTQLINDRDLPPKYRQSGNLAVSI